VAVNPSVGSYGVFENGTFSESVAIKKEPLCLIPEKIGDVAAGLPVVELLRGEALGGQVS
jgi:NADPH:quinone reductase